MERSGEAINRYVDAFLHFYHSLPDVSRIQIPFEASLTPPSTNHLFPNVLQFYRKDFKIMENKIFMNITVCYWYTFYLFLLSDYCPIMHKVSKGHSQKDYIFIFSSHALPHGLNCHPFRNLTRFFSTTTNLSWLLVLTVIFNCPRLIPHLYMVLTKIPTRDSQYLYWGLYKKILICFILYPLL